MAEDFDFQESGRVLRVEADQAEVEVVAGEGCAGCGAALVCNWAGNQKRVVLARNLIGAQPGEMVVISRSRKESLGSTLLIFGLPAGMMVAGVVAGSLLHNEWLAVIFAGLGVLAGVFILRRIDQNRKTQLPKIIRILNERRQDEGNDRGDNFNHRGFSDER